ncbi:MAG: transporter substrate-binding domain-containing protein, partial [Methyloprofundus sp.]|nr:transporter substrate-binding domain-containing protein [Methyloprofundus sp.]
PFVSHTSKNHGVLYELIDSIIKTEQIAAEINVLPSLNMAKYYFSQEDALAMIGHDFNLNKENQKKAIFIPVLAIDEYYFYYASNTDKPLNWTGKLSAFKDKTYGATKGENVQVYKKAGIHIKYARLPALLKKMQQQQVDFIREPELTVDTLIEHTLPKEKNAVIKMQPKAGKMLLGIVFNKNHKDGKQAAKQFKAGLKKMISNGQFEAVLQKHLGSDAKMKDYVNFSN